MPTTKNTLRCLVALTSFVFACSESPETDTDPDSTPDPGVVPEQLEALDVAITTGDAQLSTAAGLLAISGADRQFAVQIGTGPELVAVDLHSPGASPLTSLDGLDATVQFTEQGMGGRSVVISDATGPVYFGIVGDSPSLTPVADTFGSDFVSWGEPMGSEGDGTFVWTYAPAVFNTDAGPVELLPGEVDSIVVDGVEWRVVVTASYQVDIDPEASELPGCSPESLLGFELLRVAEEPVTVSTLTRLPDAVVSYVGCTAPGGGL